MPCLGLPIATTSSVSGLWRVARMSGLRRRGRELGRKPGPNIEAHGRRDSDVGELTSKCLASHVGDAHWLGREMDESQPRRHRGFDAPPQSLDIIELEYAPRIDLVHLVIV